MAVKRLSSTPPVSTAPADPPRWPCLRPAADGSCVLDLSASPNAKRTEVLGLHDGALRVRLAAAPVEGQANAALLRWLADELGLPLRALKLLRGDTARHKQVAIAASAAAVQAWLERVHPDAP